MDSTPRKTPSKRPLSSSVVKTGDQKKARPITAPKPGVKDSVTSSILSLGPLKKTLEFDQEALASIREGAGTEHMRTVGIVRPLVGEHESPNPLLTLFPERARAVITSDRGGSAEYGFSNLVECHQGGAEIEALYEDDLQGFTQRALEGFTTVVVAYGQTGSGKTTCMGTGRGADHLTRGEGLGGRGIAQHVIRTVYTKLGERDVVEMCGVELTTAGFKDLLDPTSVQEVGMRVMDLVTRQHDLVGQRWEAAPTAEDAGRLLSTITKARETADNGFHARSSRTHLLIMFRMRTHGEVEEDEGGEAVRVQRIMTGNVVLMDLAGSEEPPRDVTVEQKRDKRFQEGVEINKSLTALRSYVDELIVKKTSTNRPTSRRGHDLTFFIDSLMERGGAFTLIGCASPAAEHHEETKNTLKFTSKAREVTSRPVKQMEETETERLKRQVRQLMAEANRWRVQAEFLENCGVSREEQEAIERRNRALQEDVAALQRMHLESLQRRNPFVSPVGAAAGMESPMAGAGGPETLSMIKKVARARQYVKELRLIAGSSGESDAFFHPPASISETDDPTRTTDALVTWANAALHHVAAKPFCWVVQAFVRPEGDADEGATGRMDEDGDPWDAMAGPMELGAVEGNSEDVFFSAEDTARTPHRTPRRVFGGPGGGGGATPRTHGPFSADLKQVYHEAQEMESRCDTALQGIVSLARDDAAAAALQVLMETVTKVLYDSMEKRDAATGAFSEQRALIEDQQRELENLRAECGFAAGKIEEQARALEAATAARAEAEELSTFQQLEYATTRDRVTALESELSVAAAEIASLRLALGEREAAAEAARAHEAAQRDGAVADLTAQLLAAQEVSHTLTAQLAAANAALEGSQGAKSAETAALTQALEGAQAETARLRAAFEAQLAGLQTALDQSTATIDDTRAVADRAAAEAEAAVAARSEELRAMAAEFEAMSTRLAEAAGVTSAAVAQIAAMEKDVAAMTAARAALEAQVTALQASEQAAREELRVVSGQFESARNQNECLVGAEAALREQVIALVKDVEALTAANAALQADASTRVQLVPSAELEAAVTARAAAETAAAALQSAFNEKESELQAASAQITAASAAMNEKTAAYETELESTRQAFAAASAVVEARTAELSAARNDLSAALAAVEQKAAEADALQLQLRATEERAMGLQESLSALQGSAVDMTTELAATRNALSAAQAAAEEKEMQIATLAAAAAALEQQAAERTALLVELEAAQQTAAATAAALATAQGALEEKARESTALAAAAEGLQARLAGGADELAALQGTVAELQVQLEQARSCVAAREQRIEMLQQEMFGLTVRLDESQGSHNARWQIFKLENQGLLDKQKLLKAAVEEAERRAEEANAQISALNLARAQAVARAEELTTERDRLASDLARVTASAAATLEDSELVTSRVAGLEALNRALEASEEALTRRVVEQAAELARLQNVASETESLRLQLQDMAVQSPKDGGRDPDSVRMEVERLAGELRAARDEVAALQAQLEETKYELEGASHALKTARTERGKLEQKLFAVQAEAAEREAALEARLSEREGRVSALGDVSAALAALQSQVAAHQAELSRIASDKAQLIVEVEAGRRRSEALEGELAVAVATAAQAEEQLDNLRARYGDLMASHARAIDARVASPLAPPRSPKALIASHPLTHMEAEGEGEGEGAEGHAMRTLSFEFAAGATTLPHSPADRAGTRAMYDDEDDEGPEVHVQLDSPHSSDDQDGGTPRFCADFAPTPATAAALALRGADSNHVAQRKRRKTRGPDAYEDTLPEEVQRLSFSFGMHMPATIGEGSEEATLPAAAEAGAAEELPVAYDFEGGGGDGGEEMVADESAGPGAADAVEGAHAGSEGGPAVAAPNADRNSLRERILEAQRKRKELQVKTQRAKQAAAQAAAAPAAVAEDGSPGAPPAPENIPPAPATGGPTPKIKRKLGKRNWAVQETDNEVALLADRSNGGSGILGKLDGATREQLERLKSTVVAPTPTIRRASQRLVIEARDPRSGMKKKMPKKKEELPNLTGMPGMNPATTSPSSKSPREGSHSETDNKHGKRDRR